MTPTHRIPVSHASYLHIISAYQPCGHRFSPLGGLLAISEHIGHLFVDSLDTGGGFNGSGTTAEWVSLTDGKLAGIPGKKSCWLMFGRV
jgi:hypothetical protein